LTGGKGTISGFLETVVYVSVGGVDCDFVTSFLKSYGCVNHKSLGAACPNQRVYEIYYLFQDQDE